MNAIRFLKQAHEEAKGMFQQIEQASEQQRGSLWSKLQPELKAHEQMEEAHLYGPVAQDDRTQDSMQRDWNEHHHEEVREAEAMIDEIGGAQAFGLRVAGKGQRAQTNPRAPH